MRYQNIGAVYSFVSSQSTRVTDRQTDGQTDRITSPKTALAHMLRALKTKRAKCNMELSFFLKIFLHREVVYDLFIYSSLL